MAPPIPNLVNMATLAFLAIGWVVLLAGIAKTEDTCVNGVHVEGGHALHVCGGVGVLGMPVCLLAIEQGVWNDMACACMPKHGWRRLH